MLKYELGPQKALQNGVSDNLLWEQASIPSGPQVKGVSFIFTGTGHNVADISSLIFMAGGTQFMNFNSYLQILALNDALGKRVTATTALAITIPIQNIYGWPIQDAGCGAPGTGLLSINLITGTGSSAVGTVKPIFHLDPQGASNSYPRYLSQLLAAGTPTNVTFSITDEGTVLAGFIYDITNVTTLRFSYNGSDVWPDLKPTEIRELQELWSGTTVTTNEAFFFPTPLPVVSGQTKFIVTGSGAVGQIVPLLKVPHAAA
jgi:hypothetical protein